MTSNPHQIAWIFPGQGSQSVGMGEDWALASAAARRTFEEADDVLGFSLSALCWRGPAEELQLTANTQPAILTSSVAILRAVENLLERPKAVAGHSLGEYSALVAAGSLDFADALRLVRRRGHLMQSAVAPGDGAMAALIGLDGEQAALVAAEALKHHDHQVCAVANLNSPRQTVIAGDREAVERALPIAKAHGARRAVLLPVSAPFHSPLMAPAREGLTPELEATSFAKPNMQVVCNVDAAPVRTGAEACSALIRQIDGPVRWVDSMRSMIDGRGVKLFLEIGSGQVLCGLGRQIDRDVRWMPMPSAETASTVLAELSAGQ